MLNFRGTAALWWQNVEAQGRIHNWPTMCSLVQEKFGKNKYANYRRQLHALRQTGSVAEYYEHFEQLRPQILLYNSNLDESFFVEEFVSGLRDDIRSAIWLHRPENLDTACTLAMLQEEELDPYKRRSFYKHDCDQNKHDRD